MTEHNTLVIDGKTITNRFFLGTGKFKNKQDLKRCIIEGHVQVVTVAMRRIDIEKHEENILEYVPEGVILMINTSGARNASEAVRIARLAKEALGINWIKVEVINDSKYLLPDNHETVKATEALVSEGFTALPYMYPDLYVARDLAKAGASAVMPLGSLIGSGQGLIASKFINILIQEISLPVIVDAGIGKPSHAAEAMEMGAAAVLANTAVAISKNPVLITRAFSTAVKAGRMAYISGLSQRMDSASPSSPLTGFLFEGKN